MTVYEAEKLLNINKDINRVAQVSESNNYFIFTVVPVNAKEDLDRPLAPPIAIDKHTGKMLAFNPMRFSKDELKSIKRIR